MSAGWVAGSVRATALARRRLGAERTRQLASCGSLADALRMLAATAYGARVRPDQSLAAAQHEIASSVLWDLRVLAGWLPAGACGRCACSPPGSRWPTWTRCSQCFAGLNGRGAVPARRARDGVASAPPGGQRAALRAALAVSAWRDPGGESITRYGWACGRDGRPGPPRSAARCVPGPRVRWRCWSPAKRVRGGAARRHRARIMGRVLRLRGTRGAAPRAATLEEMAGCCRQAAMDPHRDTVPADLWRAEAGVAARVERDGLRLLRASGLDCGTVLGRSR